MTHINIYKDSKGLSKFFIVFGCIFTIIGIVFLIVLLKNGFDSNFLSGDWSSIFFIIEGLFFIFIGTYNMALRKYYIEWDDNELRFFLPKTKKDESIRLQDIVSVNIGLFEIEINLPNQKKILDLSNLQFEDIKKIKTKFEAFNQN
ncbi:MAG TPA: hypothetical protein PLN06_10010 [Bacteroidales bacterium]|nr:hypothetical protein [Bacteroidales bacterium]HOU96934.1 hypothetical protein [Bacteroidales bacterium]